MKTLQSRDISEYHWFEVVANPGYSYTVVEKKIIQTEITSLEEATEILLKAVENIERASE